MKKTVPFKQEINFKTNIAEITSISLEHTLKIEDYLISGDFIVSGEYKIADISTNTEPFSYSLPFDIALDDKYILDKVTVDIDDFYYEVVNERNLVVSIDVGVDNLIEKPLLSKEEPELVIEEINDFESDEKFVSEDRNEIEDFMGELEYPVKIEDKVEQVSVENIDIFRNFDGAETFSTYKVCIIREGDSIETILEKYEISKENLEIYNDLSELKIGDKLIIPS